MKLYRALNYSGESDKITLSIEGYDDYFDLCEQLVKCMESYNKKRTEAGGTPLPFRLDITD